MIKRARCVSVAAGVFTLSVIFVAQAEANTHIKTISAKLAASKAAAPKAASVTVQSTSAQHNSYGATITKAVATRERFVDYLLYEQAAAIQRNVSLLNQRSSVNSQLLYLESLSPTTPQQARIINNMIRKDERLLAGIQGQLNRNYVHLTTVAPNLESSVYAALSQLSLVAPYSPQVAQFVTTRTALQQNFSKAIATIVTLIPASF